MISYGHTWSMWLLSGIVVIIICPSSFCFIYFSFVTQQKDNFCWSRATFLAQEFLSFVFCWQQTDKLTSIDRTYLLLHRIQQIQKHSKISLDEDKCLVLYVTCERPRSLKGIFRNYYVQDLRFVSYSSLIKRSGINIP